MSATQSLTCRGTTERGRTQTWHAPLIPQFDAHHLWAVGWVAGGELCLTTNPMVLLIPTNSQQPTEEGFCLRTGNALPALVWQALYHVFQYFTIVALVQRAY